MTLQVESNVALFLGDGLIYGRDQYWCEEINYNNIYCIV